MPFTSIHNCKMFSLYFKRFRKIIRLKISLNTVYKLFAIKFKRKKYNMYFIMKLLNHFSDDYFFYSDLCLQSLHFHKCVGKPTRYVVCRGGSCIAACKGGSLHS